MFFFNFLLLEILEKKTECTNEKGTSCLVLSPRSGLRRFESYNLINMTHLLSVLCCYYY